MRKYYFLFAILFSAKMLVGQTAPPPADDNTYSMANLKGLLRLQLTITPSWMIKGSNGSDADSISSGRTNIYLHGTAEYYVTEHFSVRGDGFYFVNKHNVPGGLKQNHSVEVGASWHLRKGMGWDPYLGVCAGISYVRTFPSEFPNANNTVSIQWQPDGHIEPIWAPRIGMNFFSEKVFHFFIEAQYLMGTYRPNIGPIISLNEVRVSAGLGFNFVILKKEATIQQKI